MDRNTIGNEIEAEINASYRYKNLRELIDILLSVIILKTGKKELVGIEERLYVSLGKIFDGETTINDIKLCLSNVIKIEPLLKKMILLIDEDEYDKIVQENLGLAHVITQLGLNPDNKKLDRKPEDYLGDGNYMEHIARSYPKTFIIITNRPQDTRDFNNVPIFNLIKLSKEEMRDFIKKNVDEEDVKELLFTSINGNERFVQIINTPLILSRLIEIVRYKKEIPHSEGEIIAEFLNCLLVREKEEKQDARLDIKRIIYLLRMIAFESLEKKEANSGMTESEVLKYCSKSMDTYRFQYDALYALDIVLQLGILEKREDLYVFSHQAYQDYYYAMEELAVIQS